MKKEFKTNSAGSFSYISFTGFELFEIIKEHLERNDIEIPSGKRGFVDFNERENAFSFSDIYGKGLSLGVFRYDGRL